MYLVLQRCYEKRYFFVTEVIVTTVKTRKINIYYERIIGISILKKKVDIWGVCTKWYCSIISL